MVTFYFPNEFGLSCNRFEYNAYNFIDLFTTIRIKYPQYTKLVMHHSKQHSFLLIDANNDVVNNIELLETNISLKRFNELKLVMVPHGQGTVGKVLSGVALLGLGLSGVGLLGISATTFLLTGASLLFTSVFKHPKTDSKQNADKRSVNFSGVINVTGSGQILPLAFGEVSIGSIVVSGQIVPYDSTV